ncbi:MAG TPA: helix-turn-helix domain-containing protein [Bacteroidales bacterium]|nr:helix-turn-helix domain-containing protein [Bacteroidales bacterium]
MVNESISIEQRLVNIEQKLVNIEALLTATKTVLTFDEACDYSGKKKSFMYKLTASGKVPHYKPDGKMIYFDRAELEKWLLRNRITPASEIDEQASTYVTLNQRGGAR